MLRSVQSESGRCYDFLDVNPVAVAALPHPNPVVVEDCSKTKSGCCMPISAAIAAAVAGWLPG